MMSRECGITVEPLNNGHVGTRHFIERLSSLRRLKCTSIIGN